MTIGYKEFIGAIAGYSLLVAALYLNGYWGSFNINILHFAPLADLAKLALLPLVLTIGLQIVGLLLSSFLQSDRLHGASDKDTTVTRTADIAVVMLVVVLVFASTYFLNSFWMRSAFLMVTPLVAVPMLSIPILKQYIPRRKHRYFMLFTALLLPLLAYTHGKDEAELVKVGFPPNVVDNDRSKLPLISDANHPAAYLGRAGDYLFFYELKTMRVVYLKETSSTVLFLHPGPDGRLTDTPFFAGGR